SPPSARSTISGARFAPRPAATPARTSATRSTEASLRPRHIRRASLVLRLALPEGRAPNVRAPGRVGEERVVAGGDIGVPGRVLPQGAKAGDNIADAGSVVAQREPTERQVQVAVRVRLESAAAGGDVVVPTGVRLKRLIA